ncbi:hypothetical protein pb186bvf_020011 [Paramecium bursaria]
MSQIFDVQQFILSNYQFLFNLPYLSPLNTLLILMKTLEILEIYNLNRQNRQILFECMNKKQEILELNQILNKLLFEQGLNYMKQFLDQCHLKRINEHELIYHQKQYNNHTRQQRELIAFLTKSHFKL